MANIDRNSEDSDIFGFGSASASASTTSKVVAKTTDEMISEKIVASTDRERAKQAERFQVIADMFAAARKNGLRYPKFRAHGLVLSFAPDTGRNPGAIYVKRIDGEVYLGMIKNGEWFANRDSRQGDSDALELIAADPHAAAIDYGRVTGSCCVCGKTLTNSISIELGIGPICGGRMGFSISKEAIDADRDDALPVKGPVVEETPVKIDAPAVSFDAFVTINNIEMTKAELMATLVEAILADPTFEATPALGKIINRVTDTIVTMGE